MKMKKWANSFLLTLLIMFTLLLVSGACFAGTEENRNFDDTTEPLIPSPKGPFYEEGTSDINTPLYYSQLAEIGNSSTPWVQVNLEGFILFKTQEVLIIMECLMTHLLYIMGCFMPELTTPTMVLKYGHIMEMARQHGQRCLTCSPAIVLS